MATRRHLISHCQLLLRCSSSSALRWTRLPPRWSCRVIPQEFQLPCGPAISVRLVHSSYRHCCLKRDDWDYTDGLRPELDMEVVLKNVEKIARNIKHRKGDGDVHQLVNIWNDLQDLERELETHQAARTDIGSHVDGGRLPSTEEAQARLQVERLRGEFYRSAAKIPNSTHPHSPFHEEDGPRLITLVGQKPTLNFAARSHVELGESLDIIRIKNLGHVTGHRSYFLKGAAAMLEQALIRFTIDRLLAADFRPLSVPDLVCPLVFEGCGMRTKGLHTQVYQLDRRKHDTDLCLSGTAEVGIAGYLMNKNLDLKDLPQKWFAVSQCFRAETTHSAEAKGLYRVHQFTKVEMFCTATPDQSEAVFEGLVAVQRDLFTQLGLHFQVLDMPAHDLGAPAYRKYDIEAWMPARQSYGEISSASNCTDYQSRRLKITYTTEDGNKDYVHTLNGTACAIPRMLLTLLECYQQRDGSVLIPKALQAYMNGLTVITKPSRGLLHHTRL